MSIFLFEVLMFCFVIFLLLFISSQKPTNEWIKSKREKIKTSNQVKRCTLFSPSLFFSLVFFNRPTIGISFQFVHIYILVTHNTHSHSRMHMHTHRIDDMQSKRKKFISYCNLISLFFFVFISLIYTHNFIHIECGVVLAKKGTNSSVI